MCPKSLCNNHEGILFCLFLKYSPHICSLIDHCCPRLTFCLLSVRFRHWRHCRGLNPRGCRNRSSAQPRLHHEIMKTKVLSKGLKPFEFFHNCRTIRCIELNTIYEKRQTRRSAWCSVCSCLRVLIHTRVILSNSFNSSQWSFSKMFFSEFACYHSTRKTHVRHRNWTQFMLRWLSVSQNSVKVTLHLGKTPLYPLSFEKTTSLFKGCCDISWEFTSVISLVCVTF